MCTYATKPLEHGKNILRATMDPKTFLNPHMLTHRTAKTVWNDASGRTNVEAENRKADAAWMAAYGTPPQNRRKTALTGEEPADQPGAGGALTILGG